MCWTHVTWLSKQRSKNCKSQHLGKDQVLGLDPSEIEMRDSSLVEGEFKFPSVHSDYKLDLNTAQQCCPVTPESHPKIKDWTEWQTEDCSPFTVITKNVTLRIFLWDTYSPVLQQVRWCPHSPWWSETEPTLGIWMEAVLFSNQIRCWLTVYFTFLAQLPH